MAKGKKDKPTRKERRAQKKHVLLGGDDGIDLNVQLERLGLTTKCITGDGNCLFRALSDQYYGYDKHHRSIRQKVCEYLGQNKDTYQYFVEDDIPFDQYLSSMQQDGCFGGHMVIVGFAKLRKVNVKIYQPGLIYVINGVDDDEDESEDTDRQVLHIAYHSWEHYSSVRNIDGPYNGMPEINDKDIKEKETDEATNDDDEEDSPDSKEKVILNACPGTNIRKIRRLLRKHKGDPDKVIDALYETDATKADDANGTIEETSNSMDGIIEKTSISMDGNIEEISISMDGNTKTTVTTTIDDTKKEMNLTKNTNDRLEAEGENKLPEVDEIKDSPHFNDDDKDTPPPSRPKRLTAREKKHQAKMRQKEQQRERKQQLANKRADKSKANDSSKNTSEHAGETAQAMKQLTI